MGKGFIYVLTNPNIPSLLKIGYTTRSVEERARELSEPTGVPGQFTIHHMILVPDVELAEARIHRALAQFRLPGGEFFKISSEEAIRVIQEKTKYSRNDAYDNRILWCWRDLR